MVARLRDSFRLPVGLDVLSPLPRIIAIALAPFSLSGLIDVTPSLTTLLCATLLTTPHRHSHDQNHKHDRGRHHDHDDACANREHDKSGAHASLPSTVATAYLRLGLTAREIEVLRAAAVIQDEADIAWELFLSLHAVRERLARLEAKLGVRTATNVTRALRESTSPARSPHGPLIDSGRSTPNLAEVEAS